MLLDISIADAYGAGFEFAKPDVLAQRPNTFSQYYVHNLDANPKGTYTDDTQMSLALAEWLITVSPETINESTPLDVTSLFLTAFKRDPRQAYSRRMFKFLNEQKTPEDFLQRIEANSTRSGSAMRSAILGVLPDPDTVHRIASMQAKITHNTPEGILSASAVALVAWGIRNGYSLDKAFNLARAYCPDIDFWAIAERPVTYHGVPCVQAAFEALQLHWDDPITMLKDIVSWGGDTDSVCAIAMGIRAMRKDYVWPTWCLEALENGPYGRDYLIRIDQLLEGFWPRKT